MKRFLGVLLSVSMVVICMNSTPVWAEEPTATPSTDEEGEFIGDVNYGDVAFPNNYLDEEGNALEAPLEVKNENGTQTFLPRGLSVLNTYGDATWSRAVSNQIGIYARKNTSPEVKLTIDVFDGVLYHYLLITPTADTFMQLDYAGETPQTLNNLVDTTLTTSDYWFVGSINGGFFTNSDSYPGYGYPTGAVKVKGAWQTWVGPDGSIYECIPDHNSGYTTAYWSGDQLDLSYNGWDKSLLGAWGQVGSWFGTIGKVNAYENVLSGSYTLFADGVQTNLSPQDSLATQTYYNYSRSVTLMGQLVDGRYFLLTTEGTLKGDKQISLLYHIAELEGVEIEDALRLDGGGSTQMCFDQGLITTTTTEEARAFLKAEQADAIGSITVQVDNLNIRKTPSLSAPVMGGAQKTTYPVYETKDAEGYTWYRIKTNQWIAGVEGDWTHFVLGGQ